MNTATRTVKVGTVAQKVRYVHLYLNAIEYGRIKPWNIQLKQNQPFHILIKTLLLLIHVQLVACMTLQSSSDTVAHEVCIHALYLSHSMARL
jgi:hypothetical protein